VAVQDLVGPAWPHPFSDERAPKGRRAGALWRLRREVRSAKLRLLAPSRRASRAHMPRRIFIALALGWAFAIAMLLAAVLAIRWLG
jgi:hypothetical protein